ncbi:MAG: hypothetical protein HC876_12665 [Chloroflexaceae bacterium]|nr:hypothetical protein [Chloroflexaceae bacterium]
MKTENKKFQWLPALIIIWNLIDIAIHIAVNEVEPLRITGNIIGITAALIVLFGVARAYAPHILALAAAIVVGLNAIQSFLHGYALPMLVFIGVSVFFLLRLTQVKAVEEAEARFYQRWWIGLGAALVGVVIVSLVGQPKDTDTGAFQAQLRDGTQEVADYWRNEPIILTAFFGLDNEIIRLPPNVCRGSLGQDGMPVIFSHPIDVDTLDPEDFEVTSAQGTTSTPICTLLQPATDDGENRTALLIGEFGTAPDDEPVEVRIVGELLSLPSAGAVDFNGLSIGVIPLAEGPEIITAEVLPESLWILDREGKRSVGSGCPSEGTEQVVRVRWTGGITKPNDEEVDDVEREQYLVMVETDNGDVQEVVPFALGNLDDNDNNHDLCLDVEDEPIRVSFPAGYVTDPNGDLNPDTGAEITILP